MATYEIRVSSEEDEAGIQQRLRDALGDDVPMSDATDEADVYRCEIVTDRTESALEAMLAREGLDGAVVKRIA